MFVLAVPSCSDTWSTTVHAKLTLSQPFPQFFYAWTADSSSKHR